MTESQIVSDFIYTMYSGASAGSTMADVLCWIGVGCFVLGIIADLIRKGFFPQKKLPEWVGKCFSGLGFVCLIILALVSHTIREVSRSNARNQAFKDDVTV